MRVGLTWRIFSSRDTHGPALSARAARHLRRAQSLLRLFSDMARQLLSLDTSLCEVCGCDAALLTP